MHKIFSRFILNTCHFYYNKIIISLEYIFECSRRFKFQLNIIRDIKSVYYNSFLNYSKRDFQDMLFFMKILFSSLFTLYPSVTRPAFLFARMHFILRRKARSSSISPREFGGGNVKPASSAGLCGRFSTEIISLRSSG